MGNRLIRSIFVGLPALAVLLGLASMATFSPADTAQAPPAKEKPAPVETEVEDEEEPMIDPLGPNSACYVCHMTFVFEELARTHLAEKTTCIECHGLSAAHANDENIGATKPDITYKREQIDASCQKCHEDHDVPAQDVVARFLERELKVPKPVCTDCHGMHRIDHAEEEAKEQEPTPPAPKPAPKPTSSKTPSG